MLAFTKLLRHPLALALLFWHLTGHAAISYIDLGTTAPPATLSTYTMQPFSTVPQAAIANFANVNTIPGSPLPGAALTTSVTMTKRTIPSGGWSTWSHGYTGPVYSLTPGTTVTLTLPPNANAFYLYAEPNSNTAYNVQATTNSGATSGLVAVTGSSGAKGFGFFATAGEVITTIILTVDAGAGGFAIGEFGIGTTPTVVANVSIPTLSEWSMFAMSLLIALSGGLYQRRTKRPA